MPEPLKIAVAGIGRMGAIHALHVHHLEREPGSCVLAALADSNLDHARGFAAQVGANVPIFASIKELADARVCSATVIVTPTENHREHATTLVNAGHRVFLEKPLTGSLATDLEFRGFSFPFPANCSRSAF